MLQLKNINTREIIQVSNHISYRVWWLVWPALELADVGVTESPTSAHQQNSHRSQSRSDSGSEGSEDCFRSAFPHSIAAKTDPTKLIGCSQNKLKRGMFSQKDIKWSVNTNWVVAIAFQSWVKAFKRR